MSHKVWTTQGKVIVAVIAVAIIAFLLWGGGKTVSKIDKEISISRLEEPNNEKEISIRGLEEPNNEK